MPIDEHTMCLCVWGGREAERRGKRGERKGRRGGGSGRGGGGQVEGTCKNHKHTSDIDLK